MWSAITPDREPFTLRLHGLTYPIYTPPLRLAPRDLSKGKKEVEHDVKHLEEKIGRLETKIAELARLPPELGVIRRRGWTTIDEFALVEAALASVQAQIETASEHLKRLIQAAERIESWKAAMADKPKDSENKIVELIQARRSYVDDFWI